MLDEQREHVGGEGAKFLGHGFPLVFYIFCFLRDGVALSMSYKNTSFWKISLKLLTVVEAKSFSVGGLIDEAETAGVFMPGGCNNDLHQINPLRQLPPLIAPRRSANK